ncbi:Uncharacterised protein [Candidatus Venteria ishoeyi]|uniref:Uncharacterized protein n=1 Tax=Candidatus Venteria ishoeyi TaxID=1899563 RepID=A0A1H6F577_9GAMM|nr:Uncharacterised protein [Candidatus Venteria ishoeyi]
MLAAKAIETAKQLKPNKAKVAFQACWPLRLLKQIDFRQCFNDALFQACWPLRLLKPDLLAQLQLRLTVSGMLAAKAIETL